MRLYVDYWHLHKATIKNKYPLSRISDGFYQLRWENVFSKIVLRSRYHQVRIKDEDINKATFWTRYGHYEYIAVPFELLNVLTTFMCLMNGVFKEFFDKFTIMYLDDILKYSKSKEYHEEHLRITFQILRESKNNMKRILGSLCITWERINCTPNLVIVLSTKNNSYICAISSPNKV